MNLSNRILMKMRCLCLCCSTPSAWGQFRWISMLPFPGVEKRHKRGCWRLLNDVMWLVLPLTGRYRCYLISPGMETHLDKSKYKHIECEASISIYNGSNNCKTECLEPKSSELLTTDDQSSVCGIATYLPTAATNCK